MSIIKNSLAQIVPLRERREISGILNSGGSQVVMALNGDQFALVVCDSTNFIGTLEFFGQSDVLGTGFFPVPAYPVSPACVGGTILVASQPLLVHSLVAANTRVVYAVPVGQLRSLRVRPFAYASGSLAVSITSDETLSLNSILNSGPAPSTLYVSGTAAVGLAFTATLPAVAGLRHYIDDVSIVRSATVALIAAAAPVVVTTTNLPGNPAFTIGSDAAGVGIDREVPVAIGGGGGLAAAALGVATTIVCPAYVGVIWRVNVAYHLGL